MARTDYIKPDAMDCILMALEYPNKVACEVMLSTGLRISDVLGIRTEQVRRNARISVRESKTGKLRRVTLSQPLRERMMGIAGRVYVWEHRTDTLKHRTRQAVYKDIRRAAKALGVYGVVSPHSLRKVYAVRRYRACGDMRKVQSLLNHGNLDITMLYALADEITARSSARKPRRGTQSRNTADNILIASDTTR